ncbi:MAG: hypothetical protein GTN78_00130, partial [Gemmatimonadales bacterium]|nr:hypothetical protein [Gemmatimonadales bacterium]
ELAGTPARASIAAEAELIGVADRSQIWEGSFSEVKEGRDVLPSDPEILYTDTCVGALAEKVAGEIAIACARAAGAQPAGATESDGGGGIG